MPSLAMLFQTELDPTLTGEQLVARMLADFPDLDPSLLSTEPSAGADAPLTLGYGEQMIALLGVPAPVGDDLTEIAAFSRLWPTDVPAPSDYAAHTIVTVLRPGEAGSGQSAVHVESISDAVLLSKAIASAIALSDSIVAVYFGSANHLVAPAMFRDMAIETLPQPMLPAWVALNIAPRPDGIMTGHTRGLDMLGLMDVEIVASHESAEETFGRIVNTAIYQLENGPVIGDGDTLGATAAAEVVAHHAASQVEIDKTVLSLEFVGEEFPELEPPADQPQKRRWFGRKR
ncbi:DUF4261 domain-containing protein [Gordonia sp. (in: high G+C Gram-positive bacteria)]|uniref:DUF4261 domain-containing protein n=1 Tax=Gordonia sp. (in: high G+C Gram-positive bacteria) TaxID=84139 RepID=UPI001699CD75|nr:DUF4261 domain-containing protein [Gordonia sp. (in: high G+C Gram-positive bacteria)]NLG48355.1 DUF4261 domain-containing protein [Gordonia sp. (in: high G+C Gram-positive bacteria)]